ncbi:hypothetical protein [Niallia taxi]|uniref:hypothetical protein n=1 Tax=Niallia taxi TaxID=2499688 RepID=UPI003D281224
MKIRTKQELLSEHSFIANKSSTIMTNQFIYERKQATMNKRICHIRHYIDKAERLLHANCRIFVPALKRQSLHIMLFSKGE